MKLNPSRTSTLPLVLIILGFTLAAAAFFSASMFANVRLERVVRQTHDVSENAMPSLAYIGTMRRELADIHHTLDEAADGDDGNLSVLNEHLRELEDARRSYEALPQFAAEPAVWARAGPMIDQVLRASAQIEADVSAGDLPEAKSHLARNLAPAEASANAALLELRRVNLDEGTRLARRADQAWARTKRVSLVVDLLCTVVTAGLAWMAYHSTRRYIAAEERRTEELDAFADRVAHDIRGPLTPPLFALERLSRELPSDSPYRNMVERGARSLRRANILVRDLLVFARAAAAPGDTEVHAALPEVIAGVVQDVEPEASAARVAVEVTDLPVCEVRCAPGVLSSIVGNLVGNAVKYMPSDAPSRLVCIRGSEAAKRVRVEVSDTGAGLPEGADRRIFDPYVRVDTGRPGLGLGLATVKRLVQAHGGRVGVRSRAGHGSAWFELPGVEREMPNARRPTTGAEHQT